MAELIADKVNNHISLCFLITLLLQRKKKKNTNLAALNPVIFRLKNHSDFHKEFIADFGT
jgi:hypothetical protein